MPLVWLRIQQAPGSSPVIPVQGKSAGEGRHRQTLPFESSQEPLVEKRPEMQVHGRSGLPPVGAKVGAGPRSGAGGSPVRPVLWEGNAGSPTFKEFYACCWAGSRAETHMERPLQGVS